MQKQYYRKKELVARLSNLATVINHVQIQQSFHAIEAFSNSKKFVFRNRKQISSIWLGESLNHVFEKRMRSYLTDFRMRCINKRKIDCIKKFTVGQNLGKVLREAFRQWREQSNKETLSKELYEEGPVRE